MDSQKDEQNGEFLQETLDVETAVKLADNNIESAETTPQLAQDLSSSGERNVRVTVLDEWLPRSGSNPGSRSRRRSIDSIAPNDSASQISGGRRSCVSVTSQLSSARLREEERRVEISQRMLALKKRKELELAKVNMKLLEEELELETEMNIIKEKEKVFDKYENMYMQVNDKHNDDFHGEINTNQNINLGTPSPLMVNPVVSEPLIERKHIPVGSLVGRGDSDNEKQEQIVASVVRQLRKPVPNISTFSGDPLTYKKFMRQFKTKIVQNSDDSDECLNYLEQFTEGEPNRIVTGYAYLDAEIGYLAAMNELERRYGNEDILANAFVKRALEWPLIKGDNAKALDDFSIFLSECENAIKSIHAVKVLEYPDNLKKMVGKLPYFYHDRWRSIVQNIRSRSQNVTLKDFAIFVRKEAEKACDPTYGREAIKLVAVADQKGFDKKPQYIKPHNRTSVKGFAIKMDTNAKNVETTTSNNPGNKCCIFCSSYLHSLDNCESFCKQPYWDKIQFLKDKGLCFGCLNRGHMSKDCKTRNTCFTCKGKHPTVLHDSNFVKRKSESSQNHWIQPLSNTAACNHTGAGQGECTMAVVPVQVKMKNGLKSVLTYAFLDPGSSVSFCSGKLLSEIGGFGQHMTITLDTMGVPHKMKTTAVSGLQVSNLDFTEVVDLPRVFTKDKIPISKDHIPTRKDINQYGHLHDLNLPELNCDIGLLIGNNVPDAYTPTDIRTGPRGSPHATKSLLGWIVWNVVRPEGLCSPVNTVLSVNRAEIIAINDQEDLKQLDKLVRDSFNYEFPERLIDDKPELSQEDKLFLKQVSSIEMLDNHYVVGLPLKNNDVTMPNNETCALQRLGSLKRKLSKNTSFQRDYIEFMNQIFENGYAEEVSHDHMEVTPGRVWYIPHHGIYHPRKPNKLRVVFDCSATYLGVSLNGALLQGPDMTNNLLGVLLRFRQERIAIMGDIDKMFYQVQVPVEDRDLLRFFWWPHGNLNEKPRVYRMTVHIFGATSSPSCSSFALRQTANDNCQNFDKNISCGIYRNFYVDDYLASTENEDEAMDLIQDTTAMCRLGGFNLTKWMSSSQKVLESLDLADRCKKVKTLDLKHDPLPPERALGVFWITDSDSFGYEIGSRSVPCTRRGILSLTSSVYDPLGILAPFILVAKGILQELCRLAMGWDDEVGDTYVKKWNQWVKDLTLLRELRVERCYKPRDFSKVVSVELHNFSDASDSGYGMVSYLRLTDAEGRIHCAFVLGKARVVPLKKITIPRMELAAATAMVRLNKLIVAELDYKIDTSYYWTDSMTVLRCIANKTSRFQTFVANRLSVIQEATDVKQWRYVNTKSNPADHASRGLSMGKLMQCKQWFKGPDFLWMPSSEWPEQNFASEIHEVNANIKEVNVSVIQELAPTEQLFAHFSDLGRLRKAVGWFLVAIVNLKRWVSEHKSLQKEIESSDSQPKKGNRKLDEELMKLRQQRLQQGKMVCKTTLSVEILQKADKAMIKYVQKQQFPNDIDILSTGQNRLPKASRLIKLDPFLCDGIVRVGGRLHKSDLSFEAKHPAILPKSSHLTNLILTDAHHSLGHLGKNSILAHIRQKYWILGAGVAIQGLLSKCVTCRRYQSPSQVQKMASLPADRLIAEEPPFTRTGMDYFGPFEIKRGRSVVKRYGVIFTCLAVRAVHLELAASLDTDSCIHAIRRFIARRGPVKLIKSDNGTNLVGAEREMREEVQKWNHQKIENMCSQQGISWEFNPPSASHFGGVWERLIRIIRKVLYSLLHSQTIRLDEESLHTLFCEVEAIVNGRPLTEFSDHFQELDVLTPNHLLLLRGGESLPPGVFDKKDVYPVKRWRQVQYLADLFWSRWRKEYLPLLQTRQKWNTIGRNIKVDDLVLVVDNTPRNSWSLARVIEVFEDSNGLVRSVKLKTKSGFLIRPIAKLCLVLESNQ